MSISSHQASSTTSPDTAGFSVHRRPAIRHADKEPDDGRKEVAFIDASLEDVRILADHIREGVEIVMLDGRVEPIAHMVAWAAASAGYGAIHVVSHGDEGRVLLGGTVLDSDAITARAAELAAIAGALGDSGQVMLYGCNVGRGAAGAAFVDRLALAMGARVAASTTPTGPRALGGDWLLQAGSTAGIAPLFADDWAAYGHLLPIPLVFNVAGGIFVRPGTASYTWTFGQGASPPNLTTYAAVTHISFGNADFPAPTTDWILTRGKFQYSSDGGGSWTDYAYPGFGTNYVPVAGTVWRFVDQMPADTTTTNSVSTSWQVAAYPGQGVTSGSTIIPDNAPTGIDTSKSVFFDDASQGETVATLTPVDTGLTRNGYWEIVGQSVPGLFTLTYDSSLGNTATLKIGAGAVPAVGNTATVTARYYDTYQTDSAGNPVIGEGYTKTFTLTSVDADSTDLNFGSDLKVSTTAAGSQAAPAIATLSNGNFVTVWQSAGQGGEAADKHGIYGQIHDSAGNAIGVEFAITAAGNGVDETVPTVTALDNGRFVVAYATASASDGTEIAYRIVGADGTVGTASIANTTAAGDQSMPAIAALGDGSFVMAWGASDGVVRGQKFDATGAKSGPELVFASGGGGFTNPAVAALDNGAYVVTWGDANTGNIQASVSSAPSTILQVTNDGMAYSWESGAPLPRVAALQDGGFVIAWDSYANDATDWKQTDIFYRQYTSSGSPLNAMQQANTVSATGTFKFEASVAALSEGGFVITWQADTGDHDQNGIFGRRFSSSGTALDNSDFEINQYRRGDQNSAVTTGLASDMFATVWVDETSDTSSPGIEGRVLLLANDRPTLTAMANLAGGAEDTRQAISFADLAAAGDEADTDGTVDAFVVKALGSGTLKIGASAQTATAWAAGSNDRIDATHIAYWTPAADASGTLQAFTVVARDNNGAESSGAVPVRVDVAAVNDAPVIVDLANDASDFAENTPQYIDDQANASVADVTDSDSADFDGGSLTIARAGGAGADNGSFTFDLADEAIKAGTTPEGADGTLSIGDTVYVNLAVVMHGENWVAIGRIHGSDDGQGGHALRIDLEGSDATPQAVALFLQYLQYTAPTSGARVFSLTIDDGDGATSAPVTFTMNGLDTTAPQLDAAQHVPLDGAAGVAVTVSPRVAFDENVQFGTGKITLVRVADGGVVEEFDVATDTGTGDGEVSISGAMLTINPTVQLDYGTAYAIRIDATAIEDMAGNAFAGISGDSTYNFTTTLPAPTVAITSNKATLKAGETATITFTFSEAPTGFEAADVTVSGGSLGTPVADANNSLVYTATFTPAANTQNLSAAISVGAGTYTSAQGTANAASTTNVAITGDTLVPTLSITSDVPTLKAGGTATITFTFSEDPGATFTWNGSQGDVVVSGGTLGPISGSGPTRTATFTPAANTDNGVASITVPYGAYADAAGNIGAAGATPSLTFDTLAPAAPSVPDLLAASDTGSSSTDNLTVDTTPTFSGTAEAGATVRLYDTDGTTVIGSGTADAAGNWTITANSSLAVGSHAIVARATDAAGNVGAASAALSITIAAAVTPTLAITSDVAALKAGETATITFTFSADPGSSFAWDGSTGDVVVSGGTLSAISGSGLTRTATFTPAANTDNGVASITVAAGAFTDNAGNGGGAGATPSLTFDTLAPTVAITSTATHFKAGQTATVTFTFSEVPAGFADGDVTVTGGTLGALAATADPKVYTATFTPAANMNTLSGAIAVAGATFTDTAGNHNTASTANVDISGDTLHPTVTDAQIAISGATGTAGTFRAGDTVTVTWNNTVTGDHNPDAGSVAVDFSQFGGGTAVAATNNAGTWSATYTIAAGSLDATGRNVAVTVTDLAGNSTTQGDSSNAAVDNQAPVVTDAAIAIGGASGTNGIYRIGDTVTATWNNTVTGDQNGDVAGVTFDFSQFGGGAVAAVNNGGTWSATYTLAAGNVSAAGRNVAVTVTDDAGNSTTKADSSNAQVDLVRAAVGSIAVAGTPAANAAAIDFTVVFDEAVSGVDVADFALHTSGNATGTIAGISGSGTTYTVSVNGISGDGALRLDLRATGTGIADVAGNSISTGYTAGGTHATSFNADPVITSNGGGAAAIISLAERNAAVTTVAASDPDQDALTYSIAGGADQARFDIDAVTGALRFKTAPTVAAATDSDGDSTYLVDVRVTDSRGASDTQALTVNVLADLDGDGTADVADDDMDNDGRTNAAEDPVPGAHGGTGDGNGDGIADSRQINVASLPTAVAGNPFATLAVADGLTLTSVSATAAPGALPRNVKLPLGQFDFTIGNVTTGATVEMSIYVDAALKVNGYFKQDITGKWVSIAKSVTTVGTKTKITFDLTDGGPLDSDGIANGSITDPGGVALIAPLISSNGGDTVAAVRVLEMTRHVTTVSAAAPNAVTYAISGGADMAKFAIDATTGVLSFIAAPDFESPQDLGGTPHDNTYEVQVSATGDGEVDTQTLNVTVADVNETQPVPPVVPPRTDTVDGVAVSTGTVTNSDGSVSQVVTIPVVVPERPEVVGNNTVADIPLVKAADGSSLLMAQVPVGYGITVTGTGTPKAAGESLTDLIREIKAHTEAGSQDQNQLTGGGSGFLQALPSDKPLLVQTIVPTTASSTAAPAQALAISAAPQAANGPLTALVIDTRGLPAGVEIQLQNVEFAAIIGAVKVTGGAGSQLVWGDGSSQNIMLGADDDILHGGGGDDIVGSAGGNDQIFGDEGNDVVFGGLGNDTIDGGTGIDTVRLVGAGRADYTFRVAEGKLIVSHRDGGADGTDTVANVEKLQFTGAGADTSASGIIARMYDAMFDRAPDAAGLDYWVAMNASGMSLDAIAERFVASAETDTLLGAQGNAAFIDGLYQRALGRPVDAAGRDYWVALLEQGKVDKAGVMLALADSTEKLAQEAGAGHTLDVNQTDVATLVRMYDTLFDRKADAGGLNHWIAASESGVAMRDIAWSFVHDSEAASVFGAMSNQQFVEYLYATGLERQGSAAEVAAWAAQLDNGTIDRGDALLGFADSAEKMALVGVISTSIDTI